MEYRSSDESMGVLVRGSGCSSPTGWWWWWLVALLIGVVCLGLLGVGWWLRRRGYLLWLWRVRRQPLLEPEVPDYVLMRNRGVNAALYEPSGTWNQSALNPDA